MKRSIFLTLSLVLCCGSSSLFAMHAMAQYGYGAKSKGMAGVAASFPQDSLVVATNPAGIVQLCTRYDLGFDYVIQCGGSREVDLNGVVVDRRDYSSDRGLLFPYIGGVWRRDRCHAFGFAAFVAGGLATKWPVPLTNLGTTLPTSLTTYTTFLTPSWAWQISGVHAIGVAVNFVVGTLQVKGVEALAPQSLFPADLSNRGIDVRTGLNVHVGWLLRLHREFQVGVSWQTKSWMQRFQRYGGLIANGGDLRWPARIDLGATWWALRQLVFSGDISILYWTGVKGLGNMSRAPGLYGASNGRGFGWSSKAMAKVGFQWCLCPCFTVRAGMAYAEQPMEETETFLNQLNLATQQAHITIGATWLLCGSEINGYYGYVVRGHLYGFDSDLTGGTNNFDLRNRQHELGISLSRQY